MNEEEPERMIMSPLGCTNCRQWVRVRISNKATGNLTIVCPDCKHEHYRYCENGEITEDRWRSSARMIQPGSGWFTTGTATYSTMDAVYTMNVDSTAATATGGSASVFLRQSWSDSSSAY